MLIYHLYIFPVEVSVQVFDLLFNWVIYLLLNLKMYLYNFKSFIRHMFCRYCLPVLSFHFLNSRFLREDIFNLTSVFSTLSFTN